MAAAASDPNLELILKVMPAMVVILVASAICGRIAQALLQPRVLGEMIAGVLLGPTLFGWLFPGAQKEIFPPEVKPILYVLSMTGLTLYMFLVGAGLDHEAREPGESRRAALLAVSGIAPALLLGALAGAVFWDLLSRPDVDRLLFALFIGGALSLTAFPMLARILYERGLENTRIGRISIMAAAIDDAAAWCLLAVLSAMHLQSGTGSAVRTILLAGLFALVMLTVVRPLLARIGRRVARKGEFEPDIMYLVILVPLVGGWLTDWIGVYSVFGGFIAGLAMPRDPVFRRMLHGRMMEVVSTLLLPLFFAFSGLNTELGGLAGGSALGAFLLIMLAGFLGKYAGCGLSMKALGFGWRESGAVGALMNARGLMILIFINIGLAQQMITSQVFAMLVLVAVITTGSAMPLCKLALPRRYEEEHIRLSRSVSVPEPAGAGGADRAP